MLLITAYLAGSVPTGVLLARLLAWPDPRTVGSGNIGASNMWRAGGRRAGIMTMAGDSLKGGAPVLLAATTGASEWVVAAAGVAAIVGHCFPITLGFKGGKGVATGLGVFLSLTPIAAGAALAAFVAGTVATRMSSVGALLACPTLLATLAWISAPIAHQAAAYAIVAIVVLRHHENIRRIFAGQENRVGT